MIQEFILLWHSLCIFLKNKLPNKILHVNKLPNGCILVKFDNGTFQIFNTKHKPIIDEYFIFIGNQMETDEIVLTSDEKKWIPVFRSNRTWNFINANGEYITQQGFSQYKQFSNGFAPVLRLDGFANFIDAQGHRISNYHFDRVYNFSNDGWARVSKGGRWNFINQDGDLISDVYFFEAEPFENGRARVRVSSWGSVFWIDTKGQLSAC